MDSKILLIIATLISISIVFIQWKKDKTDEVIPSKRKLNNLILIFGIISSCFACYVGFSAIQDQDQANSTAEYYRKKFENKQDEVIALSKQIKDSTGKTLRGYQKLDKAQSEIIVLQNNAIEQLTGGGNKPILISGFSTYYGLKNKSYKINFMLSNSGKTVLRDINLRIRNVYTDLDSILKTNKDGGFTASLKDNNSTVTYAGKALMLDNIYESKYDSDNNIFNSDRNVVQEVTLNNLDRTFPKTKNIYSERIPSGAKNYYFVADLEWANGSYTAKFSIAEHDSLTYFRYWKIYDRGVRVKDLYKYYNVPYPKIPNALVYCGKVKFEEEIYKVYLNKKKQNITLLSYGSFYAQTFDFYKPRNKIEAIEVAKKTLIKVFNQ